MKQTKFLRDECEMLGRGVTERRKDWRQRCRLGVISTLVQLHKTKTKTKNTRGRDTDVHIFTYKMFEEEKNGNPCANDALHCLCPHYHQIKI